jgi:hypothetical protein
MYNNNLKKKQDDDKEGEAELDLKEIPDDERAFMVIKHEPEPMSLEELR